MYTCVRSIHFVSALRFCDLIMELMRLYDIFTMQKELYRLIDLPAQKSYTSNILEQTSDSSSK